jgi:hypothetical protein
MDIYSAAYSGLYNYSTGFYAFFLSPYLNHRVSSVDADYYNYLPYPPDNKKDLIAEIG